MLCGAFFPRTQPLCCVVAVSRGRQACPIEAPASHFFQIHPMELIGQRIQLSWTMKSMQAPSSFYETQRNPQISIEVVTSRLPSGSLCLPWPPPLVEPDSAKHLGTCRVCNHCVGKLFRVIRLMRPRSLSRLTPQVKLQTHARSQCLQLRSDGVALLPAWLPLRISRLREPFSGCIGYMSSATPGTPMVLPLSRMGFFQVRRQMSLRAPLYPYLQTSTNRKDPDVSRLHTHTTDACGSASTREVNSRAYTSTFIHADKHFDGNLCCSWRLKHDEHWGTKIGMMMCGPQSIATYTPL